jgi:archaellum biogenesis protein FlaJ (TadC family)
MTNMQKFLVKLSPRAMWLAIGSGPLFILVFFAVTLFTKGRAWFVIPIFIALSALCISLAVWAQRMRERHIREAPFPRFLRKNYSKPTPILFA